MYNTREALAYSGKLPVQQNQAGVTPQLLDLLALQKVDADKKAAAQALAMASGQANMPTVAQGIEQQALNSARGEIAQKLGLAGLAQQQAPQGPAPQQPPAQGIASAPSPLPESYQEGGIVAFSGTTDGSKVEDPDAKARARADDRPYLGSLKTPPAPAAGDSSAADAALKAQIAAILGSAGGGGAPVMSPETLAFEQRQIARIDREQDLDPEKFAAAEQARRDEMVGQNELAAIENQKKRIAGIEALYARQAEERPSSFIRGLQLMGKNTRGIGLGGAFEGVSEGIDKTNAGYTTQDIANQVAVNTLNEAMEKAIRENDLGAYNAAVSGLEKARARVAEAGKQGTTVMDVNRRTQTQKEISHDNALARRQAAALSAVAHAQTAAGQSEYKAERLKLDREKQQQQARADAELVVKAHMAKHPRAVEASMGDQDAIAEMVRDEAVYRVAAYKRNGIPLQIEDAAPAVAPTMSPNRASQFQVLR